MPYRWKSYPRTRYVNKYDDRDVRLQALMTLIGFNQDDYNNTGSASEWEGAGTNYTADYDQIRRDDNDSYTNGIGVPFRQPRYAIRRRYWELPTPKPFLEDDKEK